MNMKLTVVPLSPNCRRAIATLHHLGFAETTEIESLHFTDGTLQSDAYLARNPNGKVPLLQHGDVSLWESMAIMHYLAGLAGDDTFLPSDNLGRAEVMRWHIWETVHFNPPVGAICWETLAKPSMGMGDPDPDKIAAGQKNFHRFAKVLDDHLAGRDFLLGNTVTIADFAAASHSGMILHPDSQVPITEYTNVQNWLQRMETVPGWAASAPQMG